MTEPTESEYKNCPFCAEKIFAKAIKCKHCGSKLQAASIPPVTDSIVDKNKIATDKTENGYKSPVSNSLAWGLSGVLALSFFMDVTLGGTISMIITFILNTVLIVVDHDKLKKANQSAPNVLWLVIVPVYLFKRAKSLGQNLSYFWSWLAVFIFYLIISASVTNQVDNLHSTSIPSNSASSNRAVSVPGAQTLSIPDFIVDFNNYAGKKVVLSGFIIAMGETVILYEELGSMNAVYVDISQVDRETRKNIISSCGSGCSATLLGTPAMVDYQKGFMLLQVLN